MAVDPVTLQETFHDLFGELARAGYAWSPLIPERLLSARKDPVNYGPLVRYFGLGLDVSKEELLAEGLSESVISRVGSLRPAVATYQELFVAHSHWPGVKDQDYIYLGDESLTLSRLLEPRLECFRGKRVIDLGSGSGLLSFLTAKHAEKVLGIEVSSAAVRWATATAAAQQLGQVEFVHAAIGAPAADSLVEERERGWDVALSNPPLAVSGPAAKVYRDGGDSGIEIPLLFLDFAHRHLSSEGEVFCTATSPIIAGRSPFFERLASHWKIVERQKLHDHFNGSLYREYHRRGLKIDRIELWFLHLKKLAGSLPNARLTG